MNRRLLRWMPAVVVPAVIAAGVAVGSLPASAVDPLPAKSPGQVLALVAEHKVQALSGTVEQTSNLGLPELPQSGPSAASAQTSWLELLSGPHTARVYKDGAAKMRIQILDRMAERDVVRNGRELWWYSSKDQSAVHFTLPDPATAPTGQEGPEKSIEPGFPDSSIMPTPAELTDKLLAKLDPSTDVSVGPDVQVAGRSAYNLMLTPRSQQTLVGSVSVAVDGENGMPLSLRVTARGQAEPAFSLAYTSLSLGAPDPALFEFVPPPGTTVKELQPPPRPLGAHPEPEGRPEPNGQGGFADVGRPQVTGSGWETIVGFRGGEDALAAEGLLTREPLLQQAMVAVPGGKVLSTSLLNLLLTDDGRIFVGSVPVEMLQAAAART
jgi:outer membrane lipoprotein-sorting protein